MAEPKEISSEITDRLSPLERKIIPFLDSPFEVIIEKAGIDEVSLLRALRLLEAKNIVKIESRKKSAVELGVNGIYYKKNGLPERQLLSVLEKNNHISIDEAQKISKLSENEFKVSLGILKNKAFITLQNGKINLQAKKEELIKKMLEEQFIDSLPLDPESLTPEQKYSLEQLKKRKEIVEIKTETINSFKVTSEGKKIAGLNIQSDLIEELTPEIIKSWSPQKRFRKYDLLAPVPKLNGGRRHFTNEAIEHARKIWLELGFKEIDGPIAESSFWVFDSLFTPQDHPAREMQDTFFIKDSASELPDKNVMEEVKKAHESGWNYKWKDSESKKTVLRTHTTSLSARTLARRPDNPGKYFTIGKVFRNETLDWKHAFEFYQAEGIVIDEKANFRQLLGYLKTFYKKMGFEKIRFRPSFFAYTEPSVEIEVFHPVRKEWFELGGAGMFRPEVVEPLLGKAVSVLAWGQGFDRIIMNYYEIKDLREMYENDIKKIREKAVWK